MRTIIDTTQYILATHLVEFDDAGDEALCQAYFQAQHYLPNDYGDSLWMLGGHYDFGVERTTDGWKINELVITLLWAAGNEQLSAEY